MYSVTLADDLDASPEIMEATTAQQAAQDFLAVIAIGRTFVPMGITASEVAVDLHSGNHRVISNGQVVHAVSVLKGEFRKGRDFQDSPDEMVFYFAENKAGED